MEAKKPWQSKTMLVNGILGLAAFAALFIPAAAGLKDLIDHNGAAIAMAWGVLNMILRAVTKDKIQLGE